MDEKKQAEIAEYQKGGRQRGNEMAVDAGLDEVEGGKGSKGILWQHLKFSVAPGKKKNELGRGWGGLASRK